MGHIVEVPALRVKRIMPLGQTGVYWRHGLDENAGRRLRRLRAQVDTRNREPAELPLEEVPLDALEPGRRGRPNARGADQDGAQPQAEGEEELMAGARIASGSSEIVAQGRREQVD